MATSYVSVGRDVNGRNAQLHPTAATWWLRFALLVKLALGLDLEIIQARGTYSGSGGTHADGWCIDLRTHRFGTTQIVAIVALARTYGASATWYRTTVGSGPHIHLTVDAGRLATASRYQTQAVRAGYDGLGYLGRAHKDPHPAPAKWVTADEGIALMDKQIGTLMALTSADAAMIATAILSRDLGSSGPAVGTAIQTTYQRSHSAKEGVVALLGQTLGSSGPAVGTAIQSTYNATAALASKVDALAASVAELKAAIMQQTGGQA